MCAGGPAVSPSTATTAEASAVTAATPWVSSMTATFNEVLTSNSGYRVDASTASDFTGTVFSTASAVYPASTKLTVPGLTSLTSYYLRIAVLNQLGNETRTAYGSQVYTLTSLTAPGPGSFSDYGTRQLRLSWTAGGNPSGLAYTAQASTASNFTGTVSSAAGTDLFQNLFTGLQVNTSYYFRVWPAGGPSWSPGPVATYALSPSTATPLFSAVADQALTVSWTSGGNPAGTVYEAQVSRGADFFSQVVVSSFTRNSSAGFTGLTSNSVYYARVRAVSHGGQPAPTAYRSLSSTGTLASPVSPTAPFFQAVSNESFLALFDSGANAAGTGYVAQLSTASDFSVIHAQVSGVMSAGSNAAPFAGLESNRRYYLQTAALNVTGTPTAFSQAALPADRSTATFPAPPASSSSTVYFTSITFVWSSGNRTGTTYDILVDGDPGFGSPDASATTSLSSAAVSLSSNTVYYARVRARALEPGNPDTSYVDLSPAYTLPEPPSADPPAFLSVTFTSATVRWQARPVSPPAASSETCSGYRIQLSSAQSFTGTVHSADVAGAASTGGSVAGLAHSTTYYLRVGSLNADGAAAYTLMGSTRTLVPQISSSPVTGSTELSVTPPYPEVRFIRVSIAEKTFAVGTPVELNTSVAAELPPLAGQAEFAFIGAGAGFSLSAGGLQPTKPIPITIGYELPVGVDDRLLMLARYDDTSHKWLTLPSSLDRGAKTLTGLVDHFSFFAPLIVQPGTDVSAVEIYPIPWEPESGDSLHGGSVLTISRLPAQARVRVYTNTGELLDEGTAGASGVLHWDGRNTRGHRVGTGTYLVVIESDGAKTVRSAAVIR
ncbi:MAG: fibronectin type III domain-containing protein [Elusimicrobia bacterium]|nr:fibronectin type III domain-containing protein [Elusimicrobiota bacterium]